MTVTVDGNRLYDWPISTGGGRQRNAERHLQAVPMGIDHYSKEWDNAPMPYSIFFTQSGDAIHGTYEQRILVVRCRTAAFGYRGIGRASFARLHGLDPHAS